MVGNREDEKKEETEREEKGKEDTVDYESCVWVCVRVIYAVSVTQTFPPGLTYHECPHGCCCSLI
jgi:hypothetical protein